jgi:hypothetical protein
MLPPTKEKYDKATPWEKGYISYMFGAWPNSEIPEGNPFLVSTPEYEMFKNGEQAAILDAQDSEE